MVLTDPEVSAWGYECEVMGDREQAGLAQLESQRALRRGHVNGRAVTLIKQHVVFEFRVYMYLHALDCGSARPFDSTASVKTRVPNAVPVLLHWY